jgi:hypothetical protein
MDYRSEPSRLTSLYPELRLDSQPVQNFRRHFSDRRVGVKLAKDAHAIAPYGRAFTKDSIGLALAQRSLMEHIRSTGEVTGGPPPFSSASLS